MLATDTGHHGISCFKQYSPTDLLYSPKEKGQCEKMGPEEGRKGDRGSRSPWGQLSWHKGQGSLPLKLPMLFFNSRILLTACTHW